MAKTTWRLLGAALLVASAMPSARAAGPMFCGRSGTVFVEPGLTMTPQSIEVTDKGTFGPCQLPDGSIQSGKLFATAQGEGTCASARATGKFDIEWSNGKTSSGTVEGVSFGPTIVLTPKVTEGEFVGGVSHSVIFLGPVDPSGCGAEGLGQAPYRGWISF